MTAILTAKKLKKVYSGNTPAVNEISFELNEGEILGLLGPNGSGKTTTIQMLLGTLTPTSGSIYYFGKNFAENRSEILQSISFASAYTSLPWILTVKENLEIFGRLYGLNPQEIVQRSEPLLERFGILNKKKSRISALSAGQMTRLMLVKAFFIKPRIVLLDEPTASLDPDIANDICSFLLEEREQDNISILFSSHKMEEVMQVCDRTIFLKEGQIIADDVPEKLAKSVSSFTLKLVVIEGVEQLISLLKHEKLPNTVDHRTFEIMIDEDKIPSFLHALTVKQIIYTNIKIEEPSLEDFFLLIAKNGKNK